MKEAKQALAVKDAPTEPTSDRVQPQAAAVPYRYVNGKLKVMIVTSRRTGRWVFPKGSMGKAKEWDAAAQEAYEETGVSGAVDRKPLGRYLSLKVRGNDAWHTDVALYPLKIDKVHKKFPEKSQRKRKLVGIKRARKMLSQPEMGELVTALAKRVGKSK
jgi:8-oxo-dGTP pyrophosphatase MutT (NUDIX family)